MTIDPPRVYLHDGGGVRIGQFATAYNIDRSFTIMEPASARFQIARDDQQMVKVNPLLGMFVVIESTQYPFPWVGKMTVPSWTRDGTCTVLCRSMDALLTQRFITGTYSGSPGEVFKRMVADAASVNPTGIAVGVNTVVASGSTYTATLNKTNVYSALTSLAKATGNEWWLEYTANEVSITATAHLKPARGFDRCREAEIVDGGGGNGMWTDCKINGEATVFAMHGVGGASTVSQAFDERPLVRRQSSSNLGAGSIAPRGTLHGHNILRTSPGSNPLTAVERIYIAEELKEEGLLTNAIDTVLGRPEQPEKAMRWRVLAVKQDGTAVDWSKFDVGSIVRAVAPTAFTAGYDGDVRLVSCQPNEEEGYMGLNVELVEACNDR